MKRKSICLSLLLTLCIILSCIPVYAGNADFSDGGGNSQNYSSSGSLSAGGYRSAITLKRGKTVTAYICRTERAKFKVSGSKYKWKTSNKKIATVTSSGIVTAKKNGKVTITAQKGRTVYKCRLIVETPKLSSKTGFITKGKSFQFKITGTKQKIRWSSSNKSVVSISSSGKATAKKSGTVFIPARVSTYKFTQSVTVPKPSPTPTPQPQKPVVQTYTLGQTWAVPGQWRLTINSVSEMDERNPYSDLYPAAVYLIDYTYENIGYTSNFMDGLYIDLGSIDSKIIDSQGYIGYEYPNSPTYYPQEIPVGAKCHAQSCIGVDHIGNLKIYMDMYAGNDYNKKYSAIFNTPVK